MKLSMYGFSHGLPGVMKMLSQPIFASHSRTAFAMNSGPL